MKLITNFIVKTNQWYENLPKISGEMFYLGLVFIPYMVITFGTMFIIPSKTGILSCGLGLLWIVLVIAWRMSFKSIMEYRNFKK